MLREVNLALLKSLKAEQWKHHGTHAERGEETVEHIVRMFAGHDVNHIGQIERIWRRGKSEGAKVFPADVFVTLRRRDRVPKTHYLDWYRLPLDLVKRRQGAAA